MMRTLTHVPLAMAGALLLLVAVVAVLSVVVPTVIKSRRSRNARPAEAGTELARHMLGATGPGVVTRLEATPGPALREFCATCGKWQPGPHMDWCYRSGGVIRGCVYCAQIGNEEHCDDCPRKVWSDPLDLHVATAAALLSPAAPVERDPEFADTVEGWLRSVTPPVVPGRES